LGGPLESPGSIWTTTKTKTVAIRFIRLGKSGDRTLRVALALCPIARGQQMEEMTYKLDINAHWRMMGMFDALNSDWVGTVPATIAGAIGWEVHAEALEKTSNVLIHLPIDPHSSCVHTWSLYGGRSPCHLRSSDPHHMAFFIGDSGVPSESLQVKLLR
jgi:hypothetical protein